MKSNLIRIIFRPIWRKINRKVIYPKLVNINKQISANIPQYEIQNKHIKNARLLTTREELIKLLPNNGTVAELGVDEGDFSEIILTLNKPAKLHLVDSWGSKRYNQAKKEKVENRFAQKIIDKEVVVHSGLSTQVADTFDNYYFDWIYIDTSHSYETTIAELESYRTKIKENGIIAGHDYIIGNWNEMVRYGVIEAVNEFCLKYNWEILYVTKELNNHPSFAIRKIITDEDKDYKEYYSTCYS
jgi:hypothetical protein